HYEGVWNQDRPHERGTYYFADGKTVWYEGSLSFEKREGYG
ncbi:hypothetical protein, partial [Faecalibaculum rodentium]